MGADDKPDRLSPAEREQYLDRYVPGKIAKGEVPKPPGKWRETSTFWQTQQVYGRALEKGLDVVFGLREAGWQPDVPYQVKATGRDIKVDRYLSPELSEDGREHNIEAKAGPVKSERELAQMQGYAEKLARGENVDYFVRAGREKEMSAQARELKEKLLKRYPSQFRVRVMNDKVFQRILEAGARVLAKEERERLDRNIAKLPTRERERENSARSLEAIARGYVREIEKAKEQGREIGIEQLRFMAGALRDLAKAERQLDHERAVEQRRELGLKYHENRAVEKHLESRVVDAHAGRMTPIDLVTHEMVERERAEVAKAAREAAREIERAREQGRQPDLAKVREQHLALGNTLGAVQKTEREMFEEQARAAAQEISREFADQHLLAMGIISREKDEKTVQQIEKIGEEVKRQERARQEREERERQSREMREAEARARDQARERAEREGISPEVVRAAGLTAQGVPPPVVEPQGPSGVDDAARRGREAARERERERERGRVRGD